MLPPSSDTDTSRTAARPPSRFVTPSAARAFIPSPHSRSGPAERDPDAGIGAYPGRTVREDLLIVLIQQRSEEHTSELQSLMRISYAVFCLKKKQHKQHT